MRFKYSIKLLFKVFLLLLPFLGSGQESRKIFSIPNNYQLNFDRYIWNKSIAGSFSDQSKANFDSLEIDKFLKKYPRFNKYAENIRTFYSRRKMAYAWFDKKGMIEHASNLVERVRNLKYDGIARSLPYSASLDSLIYNDKENKRGTSENKLRLELMLTAQYFAFADVVWAGLDSKYSQEVNWYLPRKRLSFEEYLGNILESSPDKIKENRFPVNRQYELLRSYLKKYHDLEESNDWTEIKPDKRDYKSGDSSSIIALIKQRLYLLGDLKSRKADIYFDKELENAVKQFQLRHGLKDDGVIGKMTISELNTPIKQRIKQIIVNMERSRWLPEAPEGDYLIVNIPEFRLHVYSAGKSVWDCNVVVGKAIHKTVVFSGNLKYVVFSPYWNIPQSIVKNEILKDMRKHKNYLTEHNMEITGYRDGLPEIRQKPGPSNSLGLVKFLFPNNFNIYLHDTPAKSLFDESSRAFSNGCIRISEPFKLAQFLLRDDKEWTDARINEAMNTGIEKTVTLRNSTPVFITYFTAFINQQGLINFRSDIYERDDRMAEMMIADKK